jgi:hypothetical protein
MPLSEHEQRALEAMEQAVYEQDPVFAHRVRSKSALLYGRRRPSLSVLGFVVGLALMLAFCLTTSVAVGVAGFLIMLVSLDTFWTNACRIREVRLDDLARSDRTDGLANDHLRDRFRRDP